MNRLFLLLGLAAFGSGCGTYTSAPCVPNSMTVYWTPGVTGPVAGFSVPGLPAPPAFPLAQLGCFEAGVRSVRVSVNGAPVSCSGGVCLSTLDWACDSTVVAGATGGMQVVGYPIQGGTNVVEISGLDASGNQKYYGRVDVPATCGDPVVGVVSSGVAGPLSIDYAFSGGSLCAAGSFMWFHVLKGGSTGSLYDAVDFGTASTSVPCSNALPRISLFDPSGTQNIPAGVYTRAGIEEVVNPTTAPATLSNNCAAETIVHAGPESWPVTLTVGNTFACFP